jgi:hypothetical protein
VYACKQLPSPSPIGFAHIYKIIRIENTTDIERKKMLI